MTLQECLAKADKWVEEMYRENLVDYEALLIKLGATDDEIERELALQADVLAKDRKRFAAELEAWLRRDGEPLH